MHRMSLSLDDKAYNTINTLAKKEGVSAAQVIREALTLKRVLEEQKGQGFNQILLKSKSCGDYKEVLL